MPSKKQRRRREKSLRHEYEYVLLDEEGNELPVEPTELKKKETPTKARSGARAARPGRTVQPPSWQRVAKRGAIFAPVMFLMVTILGGKKLATTQDHADADAAGLLPAVQLPDGHVRLPHVQEAAGPQQHLGACRRRRGSGPRRARGQAGAAAGRHPASRSRDAPRDRTRRASRRCPRRSRRPPRSAPIRPRRRARRAPSPRARATPGRAPAQSARRAPRPPSGGQQGSGFHPVSRCRASSSSASSRSMTRG